MQAIPLRPAQKIQLLTIDDLDGRTRAAKHARDLARRLLDDLGGPLHVSAAQSELIQRAAAVGALVADIEARALSGQPFDATELNALAEHQRRALDRLGLHRSPRALPRPTEPQLDLSKLSPAALAELDALLGPDTDD